MVHLITAQDESDRRYQSLLDVSNASWPDHERAASAIRGRSRGMGVVRVLNIRIKLDTRPVR